MGTHVPPAPPKIFARRVTSVPFSDALWSTSAALSGVMAQIVQGDIVVAKGAVPEEWVLRVRDYLSEVGRRSLPNYEPIREGSPNFHRLNRMDARSYVPACFHQFSFFPWNQDVFDFFPTFNKLFRMRNLLNGLPPEKFLGVKPEEGCTARLSFQFYPKGSGEMHKHSDPVDFHQTVVPMLLMSRKGKDYSEGGGFVEKEGGEKLSFEEGAGIGDLILFHAGIPHGVSRVDPRTPENWLSFAGRWTLLFAVNKLADNMRIANAKDLG